MIWQPDADATEFRERLAALLDAIATVHARIRDDPTAVTNRADAIRILRNLDFALGGLWLSDDDRSAVQEAANLADAWISTFENTIVPLRVHIAELTEKVGELERYESIGERLLHEETQLEQRRQELDRLHQLAKRLPNLIQEREVLERQADRLRETQSPTLSQIAGALAAMQDLFNAVSEDIETRSAIALSAAMEEQSTFIATQRSEEGKLADTLAQIEMLRSENEGLRDSIDKEVQTLNAVTEEKAILVADLRNHLAVNKVLNDALMRYGVDNGVEGLDSTMSKLGEELAHLDDGLQTVLKLREQSLPKRPNGS